MALYTHFLFFLLFLTAPLNHGPQVVLGQALPLSHGLMVTGQLCCTGSGNCGRDPENSGLGRPIEGVLVHLDCDGSSLVRSLVGQNRTDVDGNFVITSRGLQPTPLGVYTRACQVKVNLPIRPAPVCRLLSVETQTKGFLVASLKRDGSVRVVPYSLLDNSTITEWSKAQIM